jgi:hypothetical protein
MTRERFLVLYTRTVGLVAGSAAFCALMPLRTMDAVHRALGMGPLPAGPIVEYLARTTSALYALLGALLWTVSFDVSRYRPLVRGSGYAFMALGALLAWTGARAGLPGFWQAAEGPLNALLGLLFVWASRETPARPTGS